ncbi:Glutamate receptor [Forsythia ovata]|uniref:Glutamate receptor n=1 Tax=Forsythia ovata TaxID=205694 RepID=A0ABD1U7E2_9LAMI
MSGVGPLAEAWTNKNEVGGFGVTFSQWGLCKWVDLLPPRIDEWAVQIWELGVQFCRFMEFGCHNVGVMHYSGCTGGIFGRKRKNLTDLALKQTKPRSSRHKQKELDPYGGSSRSRESKALPDDGTTQICPTKQHHIVGRIGAVIHQSSRIGREQKIAMELAIHDFEQQSLNCSKPLLHLKDLDLNSVGAVSAGKLS